MSHFEYISVAISLVLSLAMVRALAGLSVAFDKERRYWVHCAWLLFILFSAVLVWWNFWPYRNAEWNLWAFLIALGAPGSLYLAGVALAPENPETVESWRDHFEKVRRRTFLAFLGFFFSVSLSQFILLDLPLLTPTRIAQGFAIATATVGFVSQSRRVHEILPVLLVGVAVAASMMIFARPDGVLTE